MNRTTQLVFPEAKTIYNKDDTGNKFLTPSGEPDECAYRTAPIVHPDPKPLYKFGDQGNKYLTPSGKPDERAYRTSPLVLADPKTGHKKDVTPSGGPINASNLVRSHLVGWYLLHCFQPYRNSSFGIARPRTINEMKIGLGYWSTAQQNTSQAA